MNRGSNACVVPPRFRMESYPIGEFWKTKSSPRSIWFGSPRGRIVCIQRAFEKRGSATRPVRSLIYVKLINRSIYPFSRVCSVEFHQNNARDTDRAILSATPRNDFNWTTIFRGLFHYKREHSLATKGATYPVFNTRSKISIFGPTPAVLSRNERRH